ncbi:MAG: glycoside hydrolase family 2 TIM barrel-domain containing protein [Akkermansiaceae bacterium]
MPLRCLRALLAPVLFAASFTVPSAASSPSVSEIRYLSGTGSDDPVDWEFFCTKGRRSGEWTTIPVPSNWEFHGFGSYNYGHDRPKADEQGKYRHRFDVPAEWSDRQVLIVFEGAMTDTEVKVNGRPAGPLHQGGFYQFEHDITDLVELGGENLLEVTVSKVSANESVERAERLADFWVFGGIFRPVFLMARPHRHIHSVAIDARADGTFSARVHHAGPPGADAVVLEMLDDQGLPVAPAIRHKLEPGTETAELTTRAAGVRPWSHESPNLHHARIRLMKGAEILHEKTERFGFRTIEMRPGDGFYLNDRKIRFKGVNRHCFWPDTGRALSRKISYDDARLIKGMNMNAVRMAHYPPDKHFLDACDELGLLVINELTGWHDAYDTEVGRKLVTSMIRRDVNHPSIIIWSNGNEGGHNSDLVDDYARLDPQKRHVIHPTPSWVSPSVFKGVDTAHYPTYQDHLKRLAGNTIYMPTEFLHGLYDGGAGAGLADYWQAIKASSVGAGGFIWALTDEAVVRTDQDGRLDADGNHAPDGIVGPYREKSGSHDTIRELWSPVQLSLEAPGPDFDGRIPVANEYLFNNLNQCRFEWQLADFPEPGTAGGTPHHVKYRGALPGPDLPPGAAGEIRIELPRKWRECDVLLVTAIDPVGAALFTWSQPLRGPQQYRDARLKVGEGSVLTSERDGELTVVAGPVTACFDLSTGRLASLHRGGHQAALVNGPRFVPEPTRIPDGEKSAVRVSHEASGNAHAIQARHAHASFRWTVHPSGWLELEWQMDASGSSDFAGITFDHPEAETLGKHWIGRGPHRVWENRMQGPIFGTFSGLHNDPVPGRSWAEPEFKGCFADMFRLDLITRKGTLKFLTDTSGLFARIHTPHPGHEPKRATAAFPEGDISFLHTIPAIGTKFRSIHQLGPESVRESPVTRHRGNIYLKYATPQHSEADPAPASSPNPARDS